MVDHCSKLIQYLLVLTCKGIVKMPCSYVFFLWDRFFQSKRVTYVAFYLELDFGVVLLTTFLDVGVQTEH
jgi:hypothetical protein